MPSAAVLARLPEGPQKRELLLDCTGCHQFGASLAYPDGRARDMESWAAAVRRMLSFAGDASGFPIISPERSPEPTATFLARHLTAPPVEYDYGPVGTDVEIREYEYPYPQDLPHDVAIDSVTGQVLITGMFTHRILALDPETGAYAETPIPVPGANPRAIDVDAGGHWWVLLGGPKKLARYDPSTGTWDVYDIGLYGHSVHAAQAGRVWFNGHFTRDPVRVGFVDAASGQLRLIDVPTDSALRALGPIPYGLRVADDGTAWGTELRGNRIFSVDPRDGSVRTWTLPVSHAGPRRPDFDAAGRLWIPAYASNEILRFDPTTGTFERYALPIRDALPYVVRVDRTRGRVWLGTGAADAVLKLNPDTGRITVYRLPTRGALIRHMTVDPRSGDLWVAYGASPGIPPKIARLRVSP